jgi:very-short-patch-repair endonuclease
MDAPRPTIQRARELRRKLTPPEARLRIALRNWRQGLHFRRQHPLGPYVLGFYCDAAKLAVEIDGASHLNRIDQDERRDRWLAARGVRTLRIRAIEVRDNVDGAVAMIRAAAAQRP